MHLLPLLVLYLTRPILGGIPESDRELGDVFDGRPKGFGPIPNGLNDKSPELSHNVKRKKKRRAQSIGSFSSFKGRPKGGLNKFKVDEERFGKFAKTREKAVPDLKDETNLDNSTAKETDKIQSLTLDSDKEADAPVEKVTPLPPPLSSLPPPPPPPSPPPPPLPPLPPPLTTKAGGIGKKTREPEIEGRKLINMINPEPINLPGLVNRGQKVDLDGSIYDRKVEEISPASAKVFEDIYTVPLKEAKPTSSEPAKLGPTYKNLNRATSILLVSKKFMQITSERDEDRTEGANVAKKVDLTKEVNPWPFYKILLSHLLNPDSKVLNRDGIDITVLMAKHQSSPKEAENKGEVERKQGEKTLEGQMPRDGKYDCPMKDVNFDKLYFPDAFLYVQCREPTVFPMVVKLMQQMKEVTTQIEELKEDVRHCIEGFDLIRNSKELVTIFDASRALLKHAYKYVDNSESFPSKMRLESILQLLTARSANGKTTQYDLVIYNLVIDGKLPGLVKLKERLHPLLGRECNTAPKTLAAINHNIQSIKKSLDIIVDFRPQRSVSDPPKWPPQESKKELKEDSKAEDLMSQVQKYALENRKNLNERLDKIEKSLDDARFDEKIKDMRTKWDRLRQYFGQQRIFCMVQEGGDIFWSPMESEKINDLSQMATVIHSNRVRSATTLCEDEQTRTRYFFATVYLLIRAAVQTLDRLQDREFRKHLEVLPSTVKKLSDNVNAMPCN